MIKDIGTKLDFPTEAIEYFSDCLETCLNIDGIMNLFLEAEENFFVGVEHDYKEILQKIADKTQINRYSVDMLFLLIASKRLHKNFRDSGFSDQLFYELMNDLRYKLYECKNLYGVWGTFVIQWFRNGYRLNRFKLGRLQYQIGECPIDSYKGIVKKSDPIYYIHIPSSGPLVYEDVYESLKMAYSFYKDSLIDGKLVLFCESWLLYEPLFKDYNNKSNIKKFFNLFHIVKNIDDPENNDFWRVFNVEYNPKILNTVIVDNSLKSTVINHLENGGTMGEGLGVLIIDKEFFNK